MRSWWTTSIAALLAVCSTIARAEPPIPGHLVGVAVPNDLTADHQYAFLATVGTNLQGVWLPMVLAHDYLQLQQNFPLVQQQLVLQTKLAESEHTHAMLLTTSLQIAQAEGRLWKRQADDGERLKQAAIQDQKAFYKQPWFLLLVFGAGAVAGAGGTVEVVRATK